MQAISIRSLLWLLFIRDWTWKLFSFAMALMVYFSLRSEISNVRTIAVPLMGDGTTIMSVQPKKVYVTLRGTKDELDQLYAPDVHFLVKPSPPPQKANEAVLKEIIYLKSSNLKQIGRLRIARIEPSSVTVQFERPLTKEDHEDPGSLSSVLTNHTSTAPEALAPPVSSPDPQHP